jgi:hypothetical protein
MASLSSIFNIISDAIDAARTPPPDIPSVLLLAGAKLRPGLSPSIIASKIISRQTEAGAPAGVLPSGGRNVAEAMEVIRVEEIIDALQIDARIDVSITPGIAITANGANAGGAMVSIGQTVGPGSGFGIIR